MQFERFAAELSAEPIFRRLALVVLRGTESTNSAARRFAAALASPSHRPPTARPYAHESARRSSVGKPRISGHLRPLATKPGEKGGLGEPGTGPGSFLVAAWEQTAGRGRRGRPWVGGPGDGITASLALPLAPGRDPSPLPLLAAVALCRALDRHLDEGCRLKWPNDLLASGRKIGGILVETAGGGPGGTTAVVGFGVNYRSPGIEGATGVESVASRPPGLARLTADLASALVSRLEAPWDAAAAVEEFRRLTIHRAGEPMQWRTEEGQFSGIYRGIDERGLLRVTLNGEERVLAAAEVIER